MQNCNVKINGNIFPKVNYFLLSPAPLGGGADSAPLSNIRDNLRTT